MSRKPILHPVYIYTTHNTLQQKAGHRSGKCPGFSPDELRVAFSIPSGSLFLVNHFVSCVPQKTHSQQAMTKVKYVLVPDVK
jgi:hypothetical protein